MSSRRCKNIHQERLHPRPRRFDGIQILFLSYTSPTEEGMCMIETPLSRPKSLSIALCVRLAWANGPLLQIPALTKRTKSRPALPHIPLNRRVEAVEVQSPPVSVEFNGRMLCGMTRALNGFSGPRCAITRSHKQSSRIPVLRPILARGASFSRAERGAALPRTSMSTVDALAP